jgi:hypothetical protein
MITLLLACALPTTPNAGADEAQPESVRVLNLESDGSNWSVALPEAVPVVVACEADDGGLVYGPTEEIVVTWRDGLLTVNPRPGYVDCIAWSWR